MIAKVKIAPVERWCEGLKASLSGTVAGYPAGESIDIHTSPLLSWAYCDGRVWIVTDETANKIRERVNQPPTKITRGICEHMLEMD